MDGKLYGFDFDIPDNDAIFKAFQKCKGILERHSNILVSISGGSDSDIMLDMIVKCKADNNNIHYVFFDTGLEFDATKRHLDYLEEKYGIKIERSKPKIPVPASVKKWVNLSLVRLYQIISIVCNPTTSNGKTSHLTYSMNVIQTVKPPFNGGVMKRETALNLI